MGAIGLKNVPTILCTILLDNTRDDAYSVCTMYVERTKKRQNAKVYEQILLRESYRVREEGRSKVKKRTLLNLTRFDTSQVEAIEFALKNRGALVRAKEGQGLELREGKSVGAVWVACEIAERIGVAKALGRGRQGRLAMWQVVARLIDQGSRLSAVRLHETHALADVLALKRGLNEDDFYENLAWLSENQASIEERLFKARRNDQQPRLFLYDVTSSYLEGDCNALGAYGYDRDGKKGKKQIVIGLLCDGAGEPISVEVFTGNMQDAKTVAPQIRKTAERFGCSEVTFVGDRGMIKRAQMTDLNAEGFHYITAITKPQIEKLLKDGALQMELFDEQVCEVECDNERLILRRNPVRANELIRSRASKRAAIEEFVEKHNAYIAEHPRAKVQTATRRVEEKIARLKTGRWLCVKALGRTLRLTVDETSLEHESRLDGCYVILTDLPAGQADAKTVHARYRDLERVERGFRTSKTGHLELRPIFVRTEKNTRGHVFVVMLAYLIRRELERAWRDLNVRVEEGLDSLKTLTTIQTRIGPGWSTHRIPTPRENTTRLLQALDLRLPETLVSRQIRVATKKRLPERRVED